MRTHRVYTASSLEEGGDISLGGQAGHYLSRVLRLSVGAELVLFNGDGHDYVCRLSGLSAGEARVKVVERRSNHAESPLAITLCQALSRGERMDYSLQKATELGVAAVQLMLSERVEVKLDGKRLEKRLDHWRGVMQSACGQSGRAVVPELRAPIGLRDWLQGAGTRLVLDADAERPLVSVVPEMSVEIAVGPEGGFSDNELASMKAAGVQAVRLGPRILRTESAGPAAIAVLQATAGDFR